MSWRSGTPRGLSLAMGFALGMVLGVGSSALLGSLWGGLQVMFTATFGVLLWRLVWALVLRGEWQRIVGQCLAPVALWILFGLGGIIALATPELVSIYGVVWEETTVLLTTVFVALGACAYLAAFETVLRWKRPPLPHPLPHSTIAFITVGLVALDWYVRFRQIRYGVYFTWLMEADDSLLSLRTASEMGLAQQSLAFVTLAFLVHGTVKLRPRWLFQAALAFQLLLVTAQGDRKWILYAGLVVVASRARLRGIERTRRFAIGTAAALATFLLVIGPAIQTARFEMKEIRDTLMADPVSIPYQFLIIHLPNAIGAEGRAERQGLLARMGLYAAYTVSIHQRFIDGRGSTSVEDALSAFSVLVPRALHPNKASLDADARVLEQFVMGWRGLDVAGTPVADAFSYLHFPGILLFLGFAGFCYGLFTIHMSARYGAIGDLVIVGIAPLVVPIGDSFVGYLANLRNLFLVGLGFWAAAHLTYALRAAARRAADAPNTTGLSSRARAPVLTALETTDDGWKGKVQE